MPTMPPTFRATGPLPPAARLQDRRGSRHERGYDCRWLKIRAGVLDAQPLCVPCLRRNAVTVAEQVHHITPIREGGTHDPANLLPVCRACHGREHGGRNAI